MRLLRRAPCIHYLHSLRLAICYRQIGGSDATEEGTIFLLKTILIFFWTDCFVLSIAAAGSVDTYAYFVV